MAQIETIHNEDHSLCVEIAPDNGGMITQIRREGRAILYMDPEALELTPMKAGGVPILFPFPSRTNGDCYKWKGKNYRMPMHGLVKNSAWGMKELKENRIVLWMENNPCWYQEHYPFLFHLELA